MLSNPNPKCSKCGRSTEKTVPLILWKSFFLCGNCLNIVVEREREQQMKWLQEGT